MTPPTVFGLTGWLSLRHYIISAIPTYKRNDKIICNIFKFFFFFSFRKFFSLSIDPPPLVEDWFECDFLSSQLINNPCLSDPIGNMDSLDLRPGILMEVCFCSMKSNQSPINFRLGPS